MRYGVRDGVRDGVREGKWRGGRADERADGRAGVRVDCFFLVIFVGGSNSLFRTFVPDRRFRSSGVSLAVKNYY